MPTLSSHVLLAAGGIDVPLLADRYNQLRHSLFWDPNRFKCLSENLLNHMNQL